MISALIEPYVRTYAGKYLKNFSSDKLVIGLNTIKLTNLEVSTEHLWKFKMPFRPVRAFVGEISIDLSFVFGGKLEVNVKDVLFIFEKEEYDEIINPQIIVDSLQALISVIYFTMEYPFNTSMADSTNNGSSGMIDLESIHRMLDRVAVNIENLHFRIEEMYTGIASSSSGDMMCLGAQIGKLQVRSATSKEIATETNRFLPTTKFPIAINKVIQLEDFLLYCKWDNPLLESEFVDITSELVRSTMVAAGSEGILLHPTGGRITLAAAYQKGSLLLRPVRVHCDWQDFSFHFTNEQVLYLYHLVEFFREYPSRLQSLSRVVLLQPCPWGVDPSLWVPHTPSHRARLRWAMIRQHVKSDWWKYTYSLKSGNIRWRTWFEVWVHAARYVALREILMYHVGYEAFYDEMTQMYNYAVRENLRLFYSTYKKEEVTVSSGPGSIDAIYLRLAEKYLSAQMRCHESNTAAPVMGILDLEKDREVLKALYAMQMEYDAFLPYRIAGFCRRRAEEKYVRRIQRQRRETPGTNSAAAAEKEIDGTCLLTNLPVLISAPIRTAKSAASTEALQTSLVTENDDVLTDKSSNDNASPSSDQAMYLLFSIMEINNLSPSFASSVVQCSASCRYKSASEGAQNARNGQTSISLGETKLLTNRVSKMAYEAAAKASSQTSPKTFVQSNHVFNLPIQDFGNAFTLFKSTIDDESNSSPDQWLDTVCQDRQIVVEIYDHSIMTMSLGNVSFPLSTMHSSLVTALKKGLPTTDSNYISNDFDIIDATLGNSANYSAVSVRIISKIIVGNLKQLPAQLRMFQDDVNVKIRERKPILERSLLSQDIVSSGSANQEDEDAFILDPAQITVQEFSIVSNISQIKMLLSAVYAIPVEVRSKVLGEQGLDLPRTQHLPFLSVAIHEVQGQVTASTNPMTFTADFSVDCFHIEDIRHVLSTASSSKHTPAKENSKAMPLPRFALTLPRCTMHAEVSQISTMSRYVDGHLDLSCFETLSRYTLGGDPVTSLPPWIDVFIPKPIMRTDDMTAQDTKQSSSNNLNSTKDNQSGKCSSKRPEVPKTLIWRSHRPLAHLFHPLSTWSKVSGSVSRSHFNQKSKEKDESDRNAINIPVVREPSAEYKMRFGDWYALYPKHLNVVNFVHSWLTFGKTMTTQSSSMEDSTFSKEDDFLVLPTQKLHVSAATSARVVDCSLILSPPPIVLPSVHHTSGNQFTSQMQLNEATFVDNNNHLRSTQKGILSTEPVPVSVLPSSLVSKSTQQPHQISPNPWLGWWNSNNSSNSSNNTQGAENSNKKTNNSIPVVAANEAHIVSNLNDHSSREWNAEKTQLLQIIADLQKDNAVLKEKLLLLSSASSSGDVVSPHSLSI